MRLLSRLFCCSLPGPACRPSSGTLRVHTPGGMTRTCRGGSCSAVRRDTSVACRPVRRRCLPVRCFGFAFALLGWHLLVPAASRITMCVRVRMCLCACARARNALACLCGNNHSTEITHTDTCADARAHLPSQTSPPGASSSLSHSDSSRCASASPSLYIHQHIHIHVTYIYIYR